MSEPTERTGGIDFLKGLLIVLVVLGHMIRDKGGIPHLVIYSFHMPLFLTVSGYLLSERSLCSLTSTALLRRYLLRLGFPYLIAFGTFFLYEQHERILDGTLSAGAVLEFVLYPFHHLWFVPVYLLSVGTLYAAVRLRLPILGLTVVALGLSFAYIALFGQDNRGPEYLKYLGDKRLVYLSGYLFLGYCLRNRVSLPPNRWAPWVLTLFLFGANMATFCFPCPQALAALSFTLLNVVGAYVSLSFFTRAGSLRLEPLNWMGQESLAIYLWHPAMIVLGRVLFLPDYGQAAFYLATTLLLVGVLLPGIWFLSRVPLIGRYLFGTAAGQSAAGRTPAEAGPGSSG